MKKLLTILVISIFFTFVGFICKLGKASALMPALNPLDAKYEDIFFEIREQEEKFAINVLQNFDSLIKRRQFISEMTKVLYKISKDYRKENTETHVAIALKLLYEKIEIYNIPYLRNFSLGKSEPDFFYACLARAFYVYEDICNNPENFIIYRSPMESYAEFCREVYPLFPNVFEYLHYDYHLKDNLIDEESSYVRNELKKFSSPTQKRQFYFEIERDLRKTLGDLKKLLKNVKSTPSQKAARYTQIIEKLRKRHNFSEIPFIRHFDLSKTHIRTVNKCLTEALELYESIKKDRSNGIISQNPLESKEDFIQDAAFFDYQIPEVKKYFYEQEHDMLMGQVLRGKNPVEQAEYCKNMIETLKFAKYNGWRKIYIEGEEGESIYGPERLAEKYGLKNIPYFRNYTLEELLPLEGKEEDKKHFLRLDRVYKCFEDAILLLNCVYKSFPITVRLLLKN